MNNGLIGIGHPTLKRDTIASNSAIIAVVVVAAMCATIGAVVLMPAPDVSKESGGNVPVDSGVYSIEYVLDGGKLSDDAPDTYTSGKITELGSATKDLENSEDGYAFLGWYLDEGLTKNIMYIPADMTGDIKLYASWSETGVGAQEFFNIKTVSTQDTIFGARTTTTTGTYDRTYLAYSEEKGTFLEMISSTSTDTFGRTTGNSVIRWQTFIDTDEDEITLQPDTLELNGRTIPCESVSFNYSAGMYKVSETRYFIYGWAMIYSVAKYTASGSEITETFELRSLGTYQTNGSYEIKAYTDKGITVTNAGVYDAFSSNITLTASADAGYTFAGWYDEAGNLLSNTTTYTIDTLVSDVTVFAFNTVDNDVEKELNEECTFSDGQLSGIIWHIYDENMTEVLTVSENSFTHSFDEYGSYTVFYSGTDSESRTVYRFYGLVVDGIASRTYDWSYNGVDYHYVLNIKYSDFQAYRNDTTVVRSISTYSASSITRAQQLITSDDPYVIELANMIVDKTGGMSDYDRINVLLAFTQYIEYKYDADSMGQDEYWKYPVETLFDNNGDCEDTSILFAAIGKAMGYDTAVMIFSGHATGAINYKDLGMNEGDYTITSQIYGQFTNKKTVYRITYDEKTQYLYANSGEGYLYCETTAYEDSNGMKFTVGVNPYDGQKSRNPVNETYSPYNLKLFIPAP